MTSERAMPMPWHRRQEIRLLIGLSRDTTVPSSIAKELLDEVETLTSELLERHEAMRARTEGHDRGLAQEVERLRAALEWYADESRYERQEENNTGISGRPLVWWVAPIEDDRGERARAALSGGSAATEGE